ncbi:hypothetical protein V8Z80_08185 [Orrella sp. JC864]|uniref:hypothetical protein n=1 Tax=Orrella sp. JC864 TaxID=3120298 RepID=UPI00300B35FE
MVDPKPIMAAAKAFAQRHYVELAAEELEWQDTALLRNGRMRELAEMLKPIAGHDPLVLAKNLTHRAALEAVARVAELEAALRQLLGTLQHADISHRYQGDCPDASDYNRRDPECPACQVMVRAAALLSGKERM